MTAKFLGLAATLAFAVTPSQTMAQAATHNVANTTDWRRFLDGHPMEYLVVANDQVTANTTTGPEW